MASSDTRQFLLMFVALIAIIAIAVSGWMLQRKLHYKFGYESMVQDQVKSMVKPECLR